MQTAAKPADIEAAFRRGKHAIAALSLMARQCRDALTSGRGKSEIPGLIWADRDLVAAEIAATEPARPGETALEAYARSLPDVEAAVDAAYRVIFPDAAGF